MAAKGQGGGAEADDVDPVGWLGLLHVGLVKSLETGFIVGIVVEDALRMGYEGVKPAFAVAKGEPMTAMVDTGATPITKASMNCARPQELLNPKLQ